MGKTGLQESQAAQGGQASRGSEGSQEPLASAQVSKALRVTRGNLGPLVNQATWASQALVGPWGRLASED